MLKIQVFQGSARTPLGILQRTLNPISGGEELTALTAPSPRTLPPLSVLQASNLGLSGLASMGLGIF